MSHKLSGNMLLKLCEIVKLGRVTATRPKSQRSMADIGELVLDPTVRALQERGLVRLRVTRAKVIGQSAMDALPTPEGRAYVANLVSKPSVDADADLAREDFQAD